MDKRDLGEALARRISEQELEVFLLEAGAAQEPSVEGVQDEPLRLYMEMTRLVLDSIRRAKENYGPDLEAAERLIRSTIDSILDDSALLLMSSDRYQKFAVSTHSVNVTVFALRVAQTLGYPTQRQVQLGMAGLLHELGVVLLPDRLIHRAGEASPEVKRRPAYSAEILAKLCPGQEWLAEVVGQVYEREDGSGLPGGLKGADITDEAKILGIVDVLEACIHYRPYRKGLTGYQLIHELSTGHTKGFSERIVRALVGSFTVYPYNEHVLLSTDEIGRVVEVNPENLLRPVVEIVFDSEGASALDLRHVDLSTTPSLSVVRSMTNDALPGGD